MIRFLTLPALLLLCGIAAAQNPPAPSQAPAVPAAAHDSHPPATPATAPAPALPAANANPQSQLMLANADKLVDLARQLKTEVDKTNQFTLSLNALRRAQDVEKLAKDLQKQLQRTKK